MLTILREARCIVSRLEEGSMNGPAGLLVPLGAFVMVSWLVYTIVNGLRRWHQQRALSQFQTKLLDRIGSVNELGAFLNTEAGASFLKGLTTVAEEGAGPQARILRAVQSGAVLATLGVGLYLYGWLTPTIPGDLTNGINAVATIFFGVGVGFLAAAALSYRLSKQMGLLSTDHHQRHEPPVPTL
jgi:hypothetical protein